MHLPLTKFHMYLEDYYFCRSQTQIHGEIYRKALSDTELHKGMTKMPTNSTQTEQNTTRKRSRSSLNPATQRWWPEPVVKGWPTLGAADPLYAPPCLSSLWRWHASMLGRWESVLTLGIASSTTSPPCINRWVPPPFTTHHHKAKELLHF
jgi:hypothetical protein